MKASSSTHNPFSPPTTANDYYYNHYNNYDYNYDYNYYLILIHTNYIYRNYYYT